MICAVGASPVAWQPCLDVLLIEVVCNTSLRLRWSDEFNILGLYERPTYASLLPLTSKSAHGTLVCYLLRMEDEPFRSFHFPISEMGVCKGLTCAFLGHGCLLKFLTLCALTPTREDSPIRKGREAS